MTGFIQEYASGKESTDFDVQNVRALPAAAGSVLAWGTSLAQKRTKAGGQETCDAIPPPSVRARLSVVATQHHLYAMPPHIAHILHMLEET
jgi:hypothetical protein